jgi:uncharacterized protein
MQRALLLFTKVPDPGRVKTRLTGAHGLSPADASNLYSAILLDIFDIMKNLAKSMDLRLYVAYWPANEGSNIRQLLRPDEDTNVTFFPQDEKETTAGKIAFAFRTAFNDGADVAALVFGDQAELDEGLLQETFQTLEAAADKGSKYLVLGPTCDGGTYLIGLTSDLAAWLYESIDCTSSSKAVSKLIVQAKASNLPLTVLDDRVDLDDIDDLKLLRKKTRTSHPRTDTMLRNLPTAISQESESEVSVVIPTLNEEESLEATILPIRAQLCSTEIIVIDGGSSDGTLEVANKLADRVIVSRRAGRQHQENLGAMGARGSILLFLHGDARIPPTLLRSIKTSFQNPEVVAGGAHLMYSPPDRFRYRALCAFRDMVSKILGISGMGSSFFVRRDTFWLLGGFDEKMNEEAVDMCKRLRGHGRHVMLDEVVQTSARRYEKTGFMKTVFAWALTVVLSYIGVHAVQIEKHVWRVVR